MNCDSADEWERASKPMEVDYYFHRDQGTKVANALAAFGLVALISKD